MTSRLFRMVFTLALCSVVLASQVAAHSEMKGSSPAEGATVAPGLRDIKIGFSSKVRVTLVKVLRQDGEKELGIDKKGPGGFVTSYPFKVPPLEAGRYTVQWTAIATDGHVMKGTLSFQVANR